MSIIQKPKLFLEFGSALTKVSYPHANIRISKPTREILHDGKAGFNNGTIENFELAKQSWNKLRSELSIGKSLKERIIGIEAFVGVHADVSEVELTAISDLLLEEGVRKVNFLFEAEAASYSSAEKCFCVIRFGEFKTEVAILKGKYPKNILTLNTGSRKFRKLIQKLIKSKYSFEFSDKQVSALIKKIDLTKKSGEISIEGKDLITSTLKKFTISQAELIPFIREYLLDTMDSILPRLRTVDVEILADSSKVLLSGGLPSIKGFGQFLAKITKNNYSFVINKQPEMDVVDGMNNLSISKDLENLVIRDTILL